MAISRRNRYEIDKNSSQNVFALRKSGQINEAYNLAVNLYKQNPEDEWIQKAYAWVLIDIIKEEINVNSEKKADFFNQLLSININNDEIILKQIDFLKPKLNPNYQEVLHAENLSKKGEHTQAINLYRQLQQQRKLLAIHHESFGWAIFRYINSEKDNLSIDGIKRLLFEYIKLKNPRPSLVHSVILKFSLQYASQHSELDLFRFFQIWNPAFLRDEDKEKESNNGKVYPSLVERLLKQLVNNNAQVDIPYLQQAIGDKHLVVDTIRESYFWKIFNLQKERNFNDLWSMFDYYVLHFSTYGSSHWHSEILKIADRFMTENNSWRFYSFFQRWGRNNFSSNDWREEVNGDYRNKPLVKKVLKKIFDLSKLPDNKDKKFQWILPLYQAALKCFDNDIWLLREYAGLLKHSGNLSEAVKIYKNILLDLNDQAFAWHELAQLLSNTKTDVAISMLSKAITTQKNEDFLGDIHLLLAKLLFETNKLEEAKTELNIYKHHREEKDWKISDEFDLLDSQLGEIETSDNNSDFYKSNIVLAEEYLYSEIPWQDFLLYNIWTNEKQKKMFAFSDVNEIEFIVQQNKFDALKHQNINSVVQFKVHFDASNSKYIALQAQASNCSYDTLSNNAISDIAIVDHVNCKKNLFHYVIDPHNDGIVKFSQTDLRPKVGDFLEMKYFTTFNPKKLEENIHILDIASTEKQNPSLIKVVSGVLNLKYKYDGMTVDIENLHNYEEIDVTKPDFAFIDNYYVPKYLLRKYHIVEDCDVTAKVLNNGEKWSVFELVNKESH